MELSTFIVTYSSLWCVLFLIALPIGSVREGFDEMRLVTRKKLLYVSLCAIPLTFGIIYLITFVAGS